MAGDKTYITDNQGKLHRATRVHAVTPTDIVWSSNPNDYTVQVKIDGKWHRAVLTMDAGSSTFFDNINIDKALVTGADGKQHTALIVKPESTVTLSDIKTDTHGTIAGTTTGETAVSTYSENWSDVKWQDNVNVYKVLVTGSDGKVHTALLTTSVGGGVQVIVLGTSPLLLPDAIANSLSYVKAFGGTEQGGVPSGYTLLNGVANGSNTYIDTGITPNVDDVEIEMRVKPSTGSWYILQSRTSTIWGISGSSSGSTILLGWAGTGNLLTSAITRDTTHTYYVKATMKNGNATLYVKDETANTEDTKTATYTSAVPSLPFWLYGNQNNDRVNSGNKVFMARIKVGGKVVMDYVPSLNPSNVVGFYDTATGVFKVSAAGTLVADQTLVPTPATPIDIWCNNGVLKARHQSGLPLGYTLLEYIESTGTQYINTGTNGSQITRFVVKGTCAPNGSTNNSQLLGGTNASAATFFGTRVASGVKTWYCYDGTRNLGDPAHLSIIDCTIESASSQPGTLTDTTTGVTQTFTRLSASNWGFNSTNLLLFGGDATRRSNNATCCYLQLYTSGGLAFSGVPCRRNSDNVVGMYDLVSGQFFTNQGTGDFVAGNTVSDPVVAYADGTTETINVHGSNIFDKNDTENIGSWYSGSNQTITQAATNATLVMRAKPNTTYYFKHCSVKGGCRAFYTEVEDWEIGSACSAMSGNAGVNPNVVYSITTSANAKWIFFNYGRNNLETSLDDQRNDFMVSTSELTSDTPYEQYFNGGTATAEMLLKVGDYQDVQSILDGVVTRNVGVNVFDGTENWTASPTGSANRYRIPVSDAVDGSSRSAVLSTHFVYIPAGQSVGGTFLVSRSVYLIPDQTITTVNDFKQWLADQYAAGTPVIVVYPLAEPTTESVAGQALQVTDGDNVLEITQASLSGLELEAEYTKVA